jgi:serine protease inhibitor
VKRSRRREGQDDAVLDRPFLFAILEVATGQPVFAGQVSLPRSG